MDTLVGIAALVALVLASYIMAGMIFKGRRPPDDN